jgi:hypothetical protein
MLLPLRDCEAFHRFARNCRWYTRLRWVDRSCNCNSESIRPRNRLHHETAHNGIFLVLDRVLVVSLGMALKWVSITHTNKWQQIFVSPYNATWTKIIIISSEWTRAHLFMSI